MSKRPARKGRGREEFGEAKGNAAEKGPSEERVPGAARGVPRPLVKAVYHDQKTLPRH